MASAPLPPKRLQWLTLAVLGLGCLGLDPGWLLGAFTLALGLMAALKLREARDRAGRRLVAQQADLLPSLLQLLAALLSLAGLLQLETNLALAWPQLLRRSLRLLAAALPVALVLFLLLPRIGPFGTAAGGPGARAGPGLSDSLDPGSIATLVDNTGPAARVAFSDDRPPPPAPRYWRVLVHPNFDGQRWLRAADAESGGGAGSGVAGGAEPVHGRALERRSYRLLETGAPPAWQRQPPRLSELVLPANRNPRLLALGRQWAALAEPAARVQAARAWFLQQGFRYDRQPGVLAGPDGLDRFLFERRVGFCGHYASAFSALMRAAGVPSRVVSGY
ncbi:MAG: transglutaminaseTgpA domain-containing protein, partial [Cyanobium sp.]